MNDPEQREQLAYLSIIKRLFLWAAGASLSFVPLWWKENKPFSFLIVLEQTGWFLFYTTYFVIFCSWPANNLPITITFEIQSRSCEQFSKLMQICNDSKYYKWHGAIDLPIKDILTGIPSRSFGNFVPLLILEMPNQLGASSFTEKFANHLLKPWLGSCFCKIILWWPNQPPLAQSF